MVKAGEATNPSPYGNARVSAQRRLIARMAAEHHGAFTVEELTASVRAVRAGTGLATVYRAASALEAAGTMTRVGERRGRTLYIYCEAADHHHHLVCTGCGRVERAACPLGEDAIEGVRRTGFALTGHDVTLFGLCPDCAQAEDR